MSVKKLPKILYISDVPVELSSAGATLIYRLLEYYPKDKLQIVQGVSVIKNQPRIPGVSYHISKSPIERLRYTRFAKYSKGLFLTSGLIELGKLKKIINDYKPDVILTVGFRLMWINAFRLSKQFKIPLYVILHDDWLTTENYGKWQNYLVGLFGKMYKHAAERFCISPAMEKYYHSLYGMNGKILYPSRGKNDPVFPVISKKNKGLKFCYAGSLFTGDFPSMLNEISSAIAEQGGELHIFSHLDKEELSQYEYLTKSHVFFYGLLHPLELMRIMNESMDVAILLNSFLHEEPFRYNFSSKLVDYSSAGLPVLFWGPLSSGTISWALSLEYKAVVSEQNLTQVTELIREFKNDELRIYCAKQIQKWGISQFSYESNYNIFTRQKPFE